MGSCIWMVNKMFFHWPFQGVTIYMLNPLLFTLDLLPTFQLLIPLNHMFQLDTLNYK